MEFESIEVPGIGETVRGRPGTSVVELAGAAKYWHDKCVSARRDGFLGGLFSGAAVVIACEIVYHLIRSL